MLHTRRQLTAGLFALAAFILSIPAANIVFAHFGNVPILFGYEAPSAALVVGFTFLARDYVHRLWGAAACVAAIIVGAGLSWLLADPRIALASGVAFLCSELADMLVLQGVRRRGWSRAVAASNVVGAVVDSILFLMIAFGSLAFLVGQLLAKLLFTVAWLAVRELANSQPEVIIVDSEDEAEDVLRARRLLA